VTDAHIPSDDTAILAAHERRFAAAQMSFFAAARVCRDRPTRWNIERVKNAMRGLSDEYLAGLERKAGRDPGSYGRLTQETIDDECGVGMSDKAGRCGAASRAPEREGAFGGIGGRVEARGPKSIDLQTTSPPVCNPAPTMRERGERQPLPLRTGNALTDEHPRGVTHGEGSPLHAFAKAQDDFGRRKVPRFERINPELDGDGA
jgi:hypothetical protein